jgi:flagellar assembly protein FliH
MSSSSHKSAKYDADVVATKWQLPSMGAATAGVFRNEPDKPAEPELEEEASSIPTAEEIEQWHQQAHQEGYDEGYKEGLSKAASELAQQKQELQALIDFFEHPLNALNDEVTEQLNVLVVSLAQQLVRREIRSEPGEIIGLIRESVQLLPASARRIRITLNPDDAELVRKTLQLDKSEEEMSWKLVEDPMITRGGCEIRSNKSVINATLENRLQALAASILGGERQEDRNDDDGAD